MALFIKILIGFIALMHLYFFWLEAFVWTSKGPKIFKQFPKELFPKTKSMMINQGLYNGFLAGGLIWTFFIESEIWSTYIALFFLNCILIAGIVGGYTVSKRIFFIQAFPAMIAIALLLIA